MGIDGQQEKIRGKRAEEVASWYFRLNGFLSIPGFIVHPDQRRRFPLTEADLLAVRFPYSSEKIGDRWMTDDPLVVGSDKKILFIIVETKAELCRINGAWSDSDRQNMQRAIRRLGFAEESMTDVIAEKMYKSFRWEDENYVLQFISVGKRPNEQLVTSRPHWLQITWDDISKFLFERFREFPEKLSDGSPPAHRQWPKFGRKYGEFFKNIRSEGDSLKAINNYIETGNLDGASREV